MTTQSASEPTRTRLDGVLRPGLHRDRPAFTEEQLSAGQGPSSVAARERRPERPPRPGDGIPSNLLLGKFRDRLPIPEVIRAHRQPSDRPLRIRAGIVRGRVHADLPEADFWGYEGSVPGPTIETRRGCGRFLYKQAGFTSATQTAGEVPVTGPYMFVHGRIWPCAEVDPAWHRLRLLNASNSRVLTLALHDTAADPEQFQEGVQIAWSAPGEETAARRAASRLSGRLVVIGTEGGRLQRPYRPAEGTVRLGPGERLDVLVDLRGLGGRRLELRNEVGTALHAMPGNADASVLQLIVDRGRARDAWEPPAVLEPRFRRYEHLPDGRLRIGDELVEHHGHAWIGLIPPGTRGGVHPEMWELAEIPHGQPLSETELIQMVARRRFTNTAWDLENARTTTPLTHEPMTGPAFDELVRAPKETWTVDPGQWISYMYHCHILDHEDHTVMRPFTVLPRDIMAFHGAHGGGHEH